MRRAVRVAGMLTVIVAMAAAIGWQVRGVVTDWTTGPRTRAGWSAFLRGDRKFGCSWWVSRAVVFRAGEPARLYAMPSRAMSGPVWPEMVELFSAWQDPAARIIEIDASYVEREFGRLRTTAIERKSTVGWRPAKGDIRSEDAEAALRMVFDDPISVTSGSEVDGMGGKVFERYLGGGTKFYMWWPLTITVGQVVLNIVMLGAMGWLVVRCGREIRGTSARIRRERGLCLKCGYPVGGSVCPECGSRNG